MSKSMMHYNETPPPLDDDDELDTLLGEKKTDLKKTLRSIQKRAPLTRGYDNQDSVATLMVHNPRDVNAPKTQKLKV